MINVPQALVEYRKELNSMAAGTDLGGAESDLLKNLEKVITRNRTVFYLIIGMLVIAFILAIAFIWYWRETPTVLVGVFTATGITVPWAISSIVNLWKEISNAETLHVLLSHLDDKKTTKEIIKIISEKLYA
jgi:hypothetical protein